VKLIHAMNEMMNESQPVAGLTTLNDEIRVRTITIYDKRHTSYVNNNVFSLKRCIIIRFTMNTNHLRPDTICDGMCICDKYIKVSK